MPDYWIATDSSTTTIAAQEAPQDHDQKSAKCNRRMSYYRLLDNNYFIGGLTLQ